LWEFSKEIIKDCYLIDELLLLRENITENYELIERMMKLTVIELVKRLNISDETLDFDVVMQVISKYYHYKETDFKNGELVNKAGTNEGSCKIFSFAKIHALSEQATLRCFGHYYNDVLNNPTGKDHGNIRSFIKNGWKGISFTRDALKENMSMR